MSPCLQGQVRCSSRLWLRQYPWRVLRGKFALRRTLALQGLRQMVLERVLALQPFCGSIFRFFLLAGGLCGCLVRGFSHGDRNDGHFTLGFPDEVDGLLGGLGARGSVDGEGLVTSLDAGSLKESSFLDIGDHDFVNVAVSLNANTALGVLARLGNLGYDSLCDNINVTLGFTQDFNCLLGSLASGSDAIDRDDIQTRDQVRFVEGSTLADELDGQNIRARQLSKGNANLGLWAFLGNGFCDCRSY